jgi:uncharacterized protein (DUF1697 family)
MALVVFLRGCNVGGHRTFRPTLLAQQLKHYDVVNIGAAGTFVVRRRTTHARLRADLGRKLPFEAEVIICEGHELISVASANPFGDAPIRSDIVRFVSICAQRPRRLPSLPISLPAHGKWGLRILATEDRFLFGLYRRQMKAISYLGAIDRLLGVRATTRNWNTISAVIKVLGITSRPNQAMQRTAPRSDA